MSVRSVVKEMHAAGLPVMVCVGLCIPSDDVTTNDYRLRTLARLSSAFSRQGKKPSDVEREPAKRCGRFAVVNTFRHDVRIQRQNNQGGSLIFPKLLVTRV